MVDTKTIKTRILIYTKLIVISFGLISLGYFFDKLGDLGRYMSYKCNGLFFEDSMLEAFALARAYHEFYSKDNFNGLSISKSTKIDRPADPPLLQRNILHPDLLVEVIIFIREKKGLE